MSDHAVDRTPLAEKTKSKSKPLISKPSSHHQVEDVLHASPNENCAPSVATSKHKDESATIERLKRECEHLRQEIKVLKSEREEEQQGILRARAALEEKEYQVRNFDARCGQFALAAFACYLAIID